MPLTECENLHYVPRGPHSDKTYQAVRSAFIEMMNYQERSCPDFKLPSWC